MVQRDGSESCEGHNVGRRRFDEDLGVEGLGEGKEVSLLFELHVTTARVNGYERQLQDDGEVR